MVPLRRLFGPELGDGEEVGPPAHSAHWGSLCHPIAMSARVRTHRECHCQPLRAFLEKGVGYCPESMEPASLWAGTEKEDTLGTPVFLPTQVRVPSLGAQRPPSLAGENLGCLSVPVSFRSVPKVLSPELRGAAEEARGETQPQAVGQASQSRMCPFPGAVSKLPKALTLYCVTRAHDTQVSRGNLAAPSLLLPHHAPFMQLEVPHMNQPWPCPGAAAGPTHLPQPSF